MMVGVPSITRGARGIVSAVPSASPRACGWGPARRQRCPPRNGINTSTENFKKLMAVLGFTWVPTANIGSNQSVHFAKGDLPDGRLICSLTKHYVAVVNGQVRDTWDCRYNEFGDLKRIYGYWILNK